MTPIKQLINKFPSHYAAGKALDVHPTQIKRWLAVDAKVDESGNVWIKTKGNLKL